METTRPSFPTLSSMQTEKSWPKSSMSVEAWLQQLSLNRKRQDRTFPAMAASVLGFGWLHGAAPFFQAAAPF